ncbi:MAG TPA: hypothetical protein VEZ14_12845 [Dehalococcoidia bacterium]|nr:hypothetical protein [Dehalococcoidia bacterium]
MLRTLMLATLAPAAILMACGGGSGKSATPTATGSAAPATTPLASTSAARAAASAPAAATSASARGRTPPAAGSPDSAVLGVPTPSAETTGGPSADAARAPALLAAAMILPPDLPAGWKIVSDQSQDNAAAAAADPTTASSNQRCGRLLGRTVVTQPAEIVNTYLAGQTVSFFSQATAYATTAGAIDCSNEAAAKLVQPGQLARAFGNVFTDPNTVVVTPVAFHQVADGSFAATLAGRTNANGVVVDLVVLVVGFRKGNVTVAIGSAAQTAPPTDELSPLVDTVVRRLSAAE